MNEYILRVRAHNDVLEHATGKRPAFFVHTYGCQMNVRESEKLAGTLSLMGYEPASKEINADLVLYNTCCVRENAENKIYGNLGYLKFQKLSNPGLIIAFCGCMAQQKHFSQALAARKLSVDILFGTSNRLRFPELLWRYIHTGKPLSDLSEEIQAEDESVWDGDVLTSRGHSYKAGVNIMYGCDNFCTYCIVPHVRGRERSRTQADVLAEVTALANDGVKEIMLLGQNVNSYGMGLSQPCTFSELLRRVNEVPGIARVRFMTSHPKDFSDALICAVHECDKVCKAVHLPLQSGSTRVLARMNRRYTKEQYLDLAERLRSGIPGVTLSTDIIVGFPGETEEDFQDTLDVVRKVGFEGAFTFLFSKRTGTPACDMPDEVPEAVAMDRFKRLTGLLNPMLLRHNESRIGQTLAVMVEDVKQGSEGTYTGRADDNTLVHFHGGPAEPGEIIHITIKDAKTFYLTGEAVKPKGESIFERQ